jgi:hypothetical protein
MEIVLVIIVFVVFCLVLLCLFFFTTIYRKDKASSSHEKKNTMNEKGMEKTFVTVYENKEWGDNAHEGYSGSSGPGSSLQFNRQTYIPFLKDFIVRHNIKSVVDLGCGDFQCGEMIYHDLDVTYTGYDVYHKLIENHKKTFFAPKYSFIHLDFCSQKDHVVNSDLCILKDVLQHWSLDNINTVLTYFIQHKKFKFILICNCSAQTTDNVDIRDGGFRPLNSDYLPLKKYKCQKLYTYHGKEVSVIAV